MVDIQKRQWVFVMLMALSWLPTTALACYEANNSFESLFMALPDEAFYQGAEGLGPSERADLLKKQESATYTLDKKLKNTWVIHNKYASDSVFKIRRYVAEKVVYLCVYTSYGQNNVVECWQGANKAHLLPDVAISSFLKKPEQFSTTELKDLKETYPVSLFFGEKDTIAASITLWMNPPLKEDDLGETPRLIWNPQGLGKFILHQGMATHSAHKVRCSKYPTHKKLKRLEQEAAQ